jgi:hypothetical protein
MRRRFGNYVVAALPRELAGGSGWLADFSLEEHCRSHVEDRMYFGTNVYKSKEIATKVCFISGQRVIAQFT